MKPGEDALTDADSTTGFVQPDGNILPYQGEVMATGGKALPPAGIAGLPAAGQLAVIPDPAQAQPHDLPEPALRQPAQDPNSNPAKPDSALPELAKVYLHRGAAPALMAPAEEASTLLDRPAAKHAEPAQDRGGAGITLISNSAAPGERISQHRAPSETAMQSAQDNAAGSTPLSARVTAEQATIAPARPESTPQQSIGLTASTPATSAPPPASSTAAPIDAARPLETLIDNLVQARENGRAARGDMALRHAEFGAVALYIDRSDADMRAVVSSRDPGFAPAAQAALAERAQAAQQVQNASQADQSQSSGYGRDGQWSHQGERGERGERGQQSDPRRDQNRLAEQPGTEQQTRSEGERGTFA